MVTENLPIPPLEEPAPEPAPAPEPTRVNVQPAPDAGRIGVGGEVTAERRTSGPAQPPATDRVQGVLDALGIQGPGAVGDPEVAPVREADTDQTLRNNLRDQQSSLMDQYRQAVAQYANAPAESSPEASRRRTQLRNQVEQLGEALGFATQGGARTFSANRSFDSTIQGQGIAANADAEIAGADNAAMLANSRNRVAGGIFGDLMQRRSAQERNQASVAAAQAQSRPDRIDQARLQFAQRALQEGDFELAYGILNGDPIPEEEVITDPTGKPYALRTRGQVRAPRPGVINAYEQYTGRNLGVNE
jgi:hypothetical protein